MVVMACVDDGGGMLFNRRRQSRDRVLRQHMLARAGDGGLWVSPYSAGQFTPEETPHLRVDAAFLDRAGPGESCFVEDAALAPHAQRVEAVLLYRWNRRYPADVFFPLELTGWSMSEVEEFPGASHEKITLEVYRR